MIYYSCMQNCINQFTTTALSDRCTFIGNVNVGKDVKLTELLQAYDAVILVRQKEFSFIMYIRQFKTDFKKTFKSKIKYNILKTLLATGIFREMWFVPSSVN